MHSTIRWSLAFSFLLGVTTPALAQSGDAPDPSSEAGKRAEGKARYERGADAYAAGRFKDAIDLFLQADALAPSAALSFNIARAYEKIGDDASSLQWFRDFRRRAPDAKNGPEVDARIQELEAGLAKKGVQQVTVLSRPLGATVIIDEQPVGVTPYTGQLPPGAHRVFLSLRGYADSDQKLDLAADHAQLLDVPLVPRAQGVAPPPVAPQQATTGGAVAPTNPAAPPPDRKPGGAKFGIWPWVGIGTGAAVLGGALGFELSRRSAVNEAKKDDTQIGYKEKLDRAESRQAAARILAGIGGALTVTSGVLLAIQLTSREQAANGGARVGLVCLPSNCGLELGGRF